MRIWSKHSRSLTPAVVSEQLEKRAKIPETPASVNTETFAIALDVHEPDPETMWSSDLGYPSQSCRRPARKRSRNCTNLKRTKRSHILRPRDRKSSVHGLSTNGMKVVN